MNDSGWLTGSLAAMVLFLTTGIGTLSSNGAGLFHNRTHIGNLATSLEFWVIAAFAGLPAWLVHVRLTRWSRVAVDHADRGVFPSEVEPAAMPAPVPDIVAPPVMARAAQAQGADLAARARFVAMTFAFPETGVVRSDTSSRGPTDWPLHMTCQPRRFTLSLQHAALHYRMQFTNRGAATLGPLMIRADLIAARNRVAHIDHVDFADDALPLCHYLDSLLAGDSIELTGELRLPLSEIAAIRLGTAELLVPLMRLFAESAGEAQPVLGVSACFAIGMPPLSAGGGIQPFRLDSGPAIWRKLTARRLFGADHS
jgi:hypothetical protein